MKVDKRQMMEKTIRELKRQMGEFYTDNDLSMNEKEKRLSRIIQCLTWYQSRLNDPMWGDSE